MANGSWIAIAMTPGGDVAARTKPSPKRIGSHRGIVLILHRAIPITMMATSPLARYATSSILATAEVFPERRNCAAAAAAVCAVAAAAKLTPTSTLDTAPPKVADHPITAATTVPPRLGYDAAMSWVGSSRFAATTVTAPPFLGQGCHDQRQAVGGHRQDQILD